MKPITVTESRSALYQAHEFAELAGVTVRALHHYDRLGLLKPAHRSEAGYRLYSRKDLARLEQIVVLKFLGMPLREIGEVLQQETATLPQTLQHQQQVLTEQRRQLDKAIAVIAKASQSIGNGDESDWRLLASIIKEINMQNDKTWMGHYFTEAAKAKIEERKALWSPELQERTDKKWKELYTEVQASLHEDPASDKAQALAARAQALIDEFTGGDPEIQKGLTKLYSDRSNWPENFKSPAPPEVHDFISKAMRARKN
ncbi:MAG TPA: MerR family transcriptional regulator [Terriglobales bacterium]|nr:MerR family transcriptional regulator [Terriglobales bacterium]